MPGKRGTSEIDPKPHARLRGFTRYLKFGNKREVISRGPGR